MDKQEAIDAICNLKINDGWVNRYAVVSIVDQIEPEKPVIPQFVADWIEKNKSYINTLYNAYTLLGQRKNDVSLWVNSNQDIFARAWLDGYNIEQEKLYTVEIPNPNNTSKNVMVLRRLETGIEITRSNSQTYRDSERCQLTESEIRKDFEWAWEQKFAKEVEYENSKTHT